MADLSVKDRVYAAAEEITSGDRNPTVSSVREAAGVSNADATRFLKQWRNEKAAAGSQIAATPQAVLEQASRLAGTIWAEAARLAEAKHEALEAQWANEKKEKDEELGELVADLDRLTAEKDQKIHALESELAASAERSATAEAAAAQAQSGQELARAELADLTTRLAAAEATAEATSKAHEALLGRITATENKQKNTNKKPK